jgi:hypothetical protein
MPAPDLIRPALHDCIAQRCTSWGADVSRAGVALPDLEAVDATPRAIADLAADVGARGG